MQALYAYFHSEEKSITKQEKALFASFEKIFDLYLYLLLLLVEVRDCGRNRIAIRKEKRLPTKEDINPNTKFVDNKVFGILAINKQLATGSSKRTVSWQNHPEIAQKLFAKIAESEEYAKYLASPTRDFKEDKNFISEIFRNCIAGDESVEMFFEEKSIHWADDIDFVNTLVLKTVEMIPESSSDNMPIAHLYKDEKADKNFAKELFEMVIEHGEETDKLIQDKTENWELERIAFMDVLLMKMAIVEFLYFPTVPVKVSLNEYIELAKQYSTPKSSIFINGILDKLLAEFKKDGRLQKEGRGLVEN